ncbi:DNA endonuclease [Priestia koreensis]|uniref:DNA endonuclease n=1 Tax=Priestia koreensis TaxID=284581 RepID=UPI00301AC799
MKELSSLSPIQQNMLIASIIGDGEITKIYPHSRRKNNSYREHYGQQQEAYREWKATFLPNIFYLTPKSQTLRSPSMELFTNLYPYFYNENGEKNIPLELLYLCTEPEFLTFLYMDDGTLSITKSINHRKKCIYLTPTISLYLQCYPLSQLQLLKQHLNSAFNLNFTIKRRPDGYGHILYLTKCDDNYKLLNITEKIASPCPTMYYKTNWNWRLKIETEKLTTIYPNYNVLSSQSSRHANYTEHEIQALISLKVAGYTIEKIGKHLNRSYWSIVYKTNELKKEGRL